jgi:serine/threonine protein kinase
MSRVVAFRSLGSGPDGSAFAGLEGGEAVVVHRLSQRVLNDATSRRRLERRLALHEQAARENERGLLKITKATLDADSAVIVVEHPDHSLLDLPTWTDTATAAAGLRALREGARTLALLHAEGIVHGQLEEVGRGGLRQRPDGSFALAALGLRTGVNDDLKQLDMLTNLLDERDSIAADAFAFGGLCIVTALGPEAARARLRNRGGGPSSSPALGPVLDGILRLSETLRDVEPAWRPPLSDVVMQLDGLLSLVERGPAWSKMPIVAASASTKDREDVDETTEVRDPHRVGRFRLDALLGSGAMGRVYRGTDLDSGAAVAVKLLARDGPIGTRALQRFRKEARLLAELKTPGVAKFLGDGVEGELRYMVTELVEGEPLSARLKAVGHFREREAVDIVIELLRALEDVHGHGIMHRDLKPDNMMLTSAIGQPPRLKLIDFGIARHLDEEGSLAMTRQGAVLGTPLYMAPEQVRGSVVDQRTDLYAVGTILFELLTGNAPFAGRSSLIAMASQTEQTPPSVNELRPELSHEVTSVVAKALEKLPSARFPDARAMTAALLPLSSTAPRPPGKSVAHTNRQRWSSTWEFQSSPAELWPFVSDTERINQAIGLAAVEGGHVTGGSGVLLQGRTRQAGVPIAWDEHPFEWVYPSRLSVLRDYTEGPLRSMRSVVELFPQAGGRGTRLVHTIELEPRGLLGRALASVEVGVRTRRALDRVYRRIDSLLRGRSVAVGDNTDAFVAPTTLSADTEARMIELERAIVADGVAPIVAERLGAWLRAAAPQDVARIRPLALARRLGLEPETVVDACLHATRRGLLVMLWDLLCPTCRAPAGMAETLKALREHGHCDACDLQWALDLSSSIELIFRVHPSLRDADTGTYCLSSPAHTPHVLAQLRLPAGAASEVEFSLPDGSYRLTARRASWSFAFTVQGKTPRATLRAAISTGPSDEHSRLLNGREQRFLLDNDTGREQLVRIERVAARDDVLIASHAIARPLFRHMFPAEVLSPETMVRAGDVTLLLVEVPGASAASVEQRFLQIRAVDEAVTNAGGSVVRLHGTEGVLATFAAPIDAVRAAGALASLSSVSASSSASSSSSSSSSHRDRRDPQARLLVAIHRGPGGAVTIGERVEYFGPVVRELEALVRHARPGELVVGDSVREDAVRAGVVFGEVDGRDDSYRSLLHRTRLRAAHG